MAWRVSSPDLVGRSEGLAALEAAWLSAESGAGRVVTVTGEAGIGKTRLVDEFAARHRDVGLVVRAECPNSGPEQALPLAAFRASLAELVPGVESRGWEPGQLADQFTRRLLQRSRHGPVQIIVEDLHWADESTLRLVDYLARVLRPRPALVIVTLRTNPPPPAAVTDTVAELERLRHALRVEIARLSPDQIVRQLHGILGRPPSAASAERIIARSDGVPFLIEELAALDRSSPVPDEALPLPGGLHELLLSRTRGIGAEGTTVLRAAAAAAGDVNDAALCTVTGLQPADVEGQLRALVRAGLLTPSGRSYRFRHALLREAIEADLLPHEMVALHTAYGGLSDRAAADGHVQADRHHLVVTAAYHWWRAGDRPRAYPAAVAAAESALRVGAPAEELRLLRRALQLHGTDDQPDGPELNRRAADAAMRSGEPLAAYPLYEAAWRGLGSDAPPERKARILAEEAAILEDLGEPLPHVEEALRSLLDTLPAGPGPARSYALAGLVSFLWRRRELDQARQVVQEALAGAPPQGELGVGLQMRHASLIALRNRTEEALEQYGAVAAQAQDIGGVPQFATLALVNQSDLLLALGRADESAAVAREGLRLGDIIPTSEATRDFLVGNLAEALIDLGDLEGAQAALEDRLRVDRGNPQRGALYTALALVRLRRGELTEAAEAAEAAHQRFADLILDAQFVVPLATVDAELALAHGDPDRALELTRGVAEAYARHVWGRLVWPLMHVAARAASPRRPAWLTALIDELDDANQRYGPAQPNHAAQVRAALAGTRQAAPSDKRRPPSDLTARELEVLRLAAVGLNNPAIAAELVISRKTASVHVSHILDKLGAHTRGEAVAIALRRGTLTQADLEHLRPSEIRH